METKKDILSRSNMVNHVFQQIHCFVESPADFPLFSHWVPRHPAAFSTVQVFTAVPKMMPYSMVYVQGMTGPGGSEQETIENRPQRNGEKPTTPKGKSFKSMIFLF